MRVKLQLVMCSDDGREETVTDLVTPAEGLYTLCASRFVAQGSQTAPHHHPAPHAAATG
jgi:hypothetical protein